MTNTSKRYDPHTLRSIYDSNGGDALLENCQHICGTTVSFSSENVRHPGTINQQKITHIKPGFKMVEIVYEHEDQSVVRSIKYLLIDGVEYRSEHIIHNAYSMQIIPKRFLK